MDMWFSLQSCHFVGELLKIIKTELKTFMSVPEVPVTNFSPLRFSFFHIGKVK